MDRKLIVMRHAKSSWDSPGQADHQRSLNDRGKRDSPRVALHLASLDWQPQFVLSSDAQRTRETAALMLSVWEAGIDANYSANLYLAGTDQLEEEIGSVSEEVETLLTLGHNPGWESVVHRLTGESIVMKTGTAALLTGFCETWKQAFAISWTLDDVVYPRDLS